MLRFCEHQQRSKVPGTILRNSRCSPQVHTLTWRVVVHTRTDESSQRLAQRDCRHGASSTFRHTPPPQPDPRGHATNPHPTTLRSHRNAQCPAHMPRSSREDRATPRAANPAEQSSPAPAAQFLEEPRAQQGRGHSSGHVARFCGKERRAQYYHAGLRPVRMQCPESSHHGQCGYGLASLHSCLATSEEFCG